MDEYGTSGHSNLLVIPHGPGPLIELPPERSRDEIDEMLDDLFGEPPDEGPGPLDVVLIAGGASLAVTALVIGLPHWLLAAGVAAFALGLVLPLHHFGKLVVRARSLRRAREVMGRGTPLDVGHRSTRRLAEAYRRVERMTEAEFGADALDLAHHAALEVAGLLRGRPPQGPAEERYVAERADAISHLADRLERPVVVAEPEPDVDEDVLRDAAVQAVRDLEERTGSGSLTRMEHLAKLLDQPERPDDTARRA
jgi:hypothetical protein